MVLEYHNNLDPPESCRSTDYDVKDALWSWWLNDRELATFLKETYNLPVHYGTVEIPMEADAVKTTITATWNETGSKPSSLTSSQVNEPTGSIPIAFRFHWNVGNGTGMLDLKTMNTYSSAQPFVIQAEMNPPMLNSQSKTPVLFGVGQVMPSVEMTGTFTLFSDRECKQPIS
jgi:hypothetical protein